MPGFARSAQSLMPFGLPLRTMNTMVDVYGALLFGNRLSQLSGNSFACCAMLSMYAASASVTTSPGRPSMTARAWRPDPPCDWLMRTVWPVLAFQYFTNAVLKDSYNSRVG